jgi:hypothetical protein
MASATRMEKDPLGELPVPADALYGVQTVRARQNFPISGLPPLPAFVEAVVRIKRAAALTHRQTGRLEARLADAIVQAADEVLAGQHREHFVVDPYQAGAGTSHNMNVNEVLANRANELLGGARGTYKPVHPNDHVNMAQSTNDTIPTNIRLAALSQLGGLVAAFEGLRDALAEKGREFDHIVKAGRTHLQDAMPIRLGQEFTAYAGSIDRAVRRVKEAADYLRDLGIGGSAVGTGVTVEKEYPRLMNRHLKEITGLDLRVGEDRIQLMQSMGDAAAFSATLRGLAIDLSKIASDLRLMVMGPRTGHRRDQAPGRAAGQLDHAGQDQPEHPRDGQPGVLPGDGVRHHGGHRQRARAARAQRDDAGHRAQRPALDADPHEHRHRAHREDGARHRGQRGDVRLLGRALGGAGHRAHAAHRLRQGGGAQQAVGERRTCSFASSSRARRCCRRIRSRRCSTCAR